VLIFPKNFLVSFSQKQLPFSKKKRSNGFDFLLMFFYFCVACLEKVFKAGKRRNL